MKNLFLVVLDFVGANAIHEFYQQFDWKHTSV